MLLPMTIPGDEDVNVSNLWGKNADGEKEGKKCTVFRGQVGLLKLAKNIVERCDGLACRNEDGLKSIREKFATQL